MTKTKKLLILLGVLVLLIAAYALVRFLGDDTTEQPSVDDSDVQTPTVHTFFELNTADMIEFSYTLGEAVYDYTLSADKTRWTWEGDATLPISNTEITLMMTGVVTLTSNVCYEDITEAQRADYGLGAQSDPQRVTFRFSDGSEQTLLFGKTNSYAGGVYCSLATEPDKVYVVDGGIPSAFALLPSELVEDDELPSFTKTRFSGFMLTQGDHVCVAEYGYEDEQVDEDDQKQLMITVDNGELQIPDTAQQEALIAAVLDWELREALTFDPALHADYGVSDDTADTLCVYYTYDVDYTDENTGATNSATMQGMYKLLLGHTAEDGLTYVRLSDKTGVYALDLSAVTALAN